jgi:hypothetical protein
VTKVAKPKPKQAAMKVAMKRMAKELPPGCRVSVEGPHPRQNMAESESETEYGVPDRSS